METYFDFTKRQGVVPVTANGDVLCRKLNSELANGRLAMVRGLSWEFSKPRHSKKVAEMVVGPTN